MATTNQQKSPRYLIQMSKAYRGSLNKLYAARLVANHRLARLKGRPVVLILGAPDHYNLGDQAIAQAQNEFITSPFIKMALINVPRPLLMHDRKNILSRIIKNDDIIVGPGGGNMGDTYMEEELCRRQFIQSYPKNKIIIFPQTIYFSDTSTGRNEQKKSTTIYSKHTDLTIIAREQTSYKEMLRVFPKNTVILTPDIVLSTNYSAINQQRKGVLLCLRNDLESKLSTKDSEKIAAFSKKNFNKIKETDTISTAKLFELRSKQHAVKNKLNEFREAKFVLTDRLHGMVFAAITGTPCIALTNFNHKVKGTHKWLEHLPYIKYCDDINNLDRIFKELDLEQRYTYDSEHFSTYWKKISDTITNVNKQATRANKAR